MKDRIARGRRARSRRGTAIVEFAACVPFLALVVIVTFFSGWAMVNQQHVWAADRYAAWRQVRTGTVPTDDELNRDFFASFQPSPDQFFGSRQRGNRAR